MSVRRLAEDTVQPAQFAFSQENAVWAERLIGRYPEGRQQSAVIPLLMRAQEQDGWVTKAAIEHVAGRLAMPLIRVLEVATFYTQFQLKPVGTRAHVQVCGTTPCMLRGSDALKKVCREKIHHDQFHLNADGTLSWEEVECLGACVNAPMVMIFKDTYEDLTAERLGEIIDAFARGEGADVPVGPQIDRHLSAPVGGATTLVSEDGDKGANGRGDGGPAEDGAPPQGAGAGGPNEMPPSQAARPDTHAPETDASMSAPGKAQNGNTNQHAEGEEKIDVAAGADQPGQGQTGGTEQGPTGAAEKDADATERGSAAKDADDIRSDGPLGEKGHAAEEAVVQDHKPVEGVDNASEHGVPAAQGAAAEGDEAAAAADAAPGLAESASDDMATSGRDPRPTDGPTRAEADIRPPLEAGRVTDDVATGPVAAEVGERIAAQDAERREADETGESRPASDALVDQGVTRSGRSMPGDVGYTPPDGNAEGSNGRAADGGETEERRSDRLVESQAGDAEEIVADVYPDAPDDEANAPQSERPGNLLSQPEGEPDDLKAISGVDIETERTLNDLGVFHFRQIAAWGDAELAWVDRYGNFEGRATGGGWTEEARALDAAKPASDR